MKNKIILFFLIFSFCLSIDFVSAKNNQGSKKATKKNKTLSSNPQSESKPITKLEPDPAALFLQKTKLLLGEYELDHGTDTCQEGILTFVKSDDNMITLMLGSRIFAWGIDKSERQIKEQDCTTEIKNQVEDQKFKGIVRQACGNTLSDTITEVKVQGDNLNYDRKVVANGTESIEKCFLKRVANR